MSDIEILLDSISIPSPGSPVPVTRDAYSSTENLPSLQAAVNKSSSMPRLFSNGQWGDKVLRMHSKLLPLIDDYGLDEPIKYTNSGGAEQTIPGLGLKDSFHRLLQNPLYHGALYHAFNTMAKSERRYDDYPFLDMCERAPLSGSRLHMEDWESNAPAYKAASMESDTKRKQQMYYMPVTKERAPELRNLYNFYHHLEGFHDTLTSARGTKTGHIPANKMEEHIQHVEGLGNSIADILQTNGIDPNDENHPFSHSREFLRNLSSYLSDLTTGSGPHEGESHNSYILKNHDIGFRGDPTRENLQIGSGPGGPIKINDLITQEIHKLVPPVNSLKPNDNPGIIHHLMHQYVGSQPDSKEKQDFLADYSLNHSALLAKSLDNFKTAILENVNRAKVKSAKYYPGLGFTQGFLDEENKNAAKGLTSPEYLSMLAHMEKEHNRLFNGWTPPRDYVKTGSGTPVSFEYNPSENRLTYPGDVSWDSGDLNDRWRARLNHLTSGQSWSFSPRDTKKVRDTPYSPDLFGGISLGRTLSLRQIHKDRLTTAARDTQYEAARPDSSNFDEMMKHIGSRFPYALGGESQSFQKSLRAGSLYELDPKGNPDTSKPLYEPDFHGYSKPGYIPTDAEKLARLHRLAAEEIKNWESVIPDDLHGQSKNISLATTYENRPASKQDYRFTPIPSESIRVGNVDKFRGDLDKTAESIADRLKTAYAIRSNGGDVFSQLQAAKHPDMQDYVAWRLSELYKDADSRSKSEMVSNPEKYLDKYIEDLEGQQKLLDLGEDTRAKVQKAREKANLARITLHITHGNRALAALGQLIGSPEGDTRKIYEQQFGSRSDYLENEIHHYHPGNSHEFENTPMVGRLIHYLANNGSRSKFIMRNSNGNIQSERIRLYPTLRDMVGMSYGGEFEHLRTPRTPKMIYGHGSMVSFPELRGMNPTEIRNATDKYYDSLVNEANGTNLSSSRINEARVGRYAPNDKDALDAEYKQKLLREGINHGILSTGNTPGAYAQIGLLRHALRLGWDKYSQEHGDEDDLPPTMAETVLSTQNPHHSKFLEHMERFLSDTANHEAIAKDASYDPNNPVNDEPVDTHYDAPLWATAKNYDAAHGIITPMHNFTAGHVATAIRKWWPLVQRYSKDPNRVRNGGNVNFWHRDGLGEMLGIDPTRTMSHLKSQTRIGPFPPPRLMEQLHRRFTQDVGRIAIHTAQNPLELFSNVPGSAYPSGPRRTSKSALDDLDHIRRSFKAGNVSNASLLSLLQSIHPGIHQDLSSATISDILKSIGHNVVGLAKVNK